MTSEASLDQAGLPALLPTRDDYRERLKLILPQEVTGVTYTANPAASAVVFVAMYFGALGPAITIRPSMVAWMSDPVSELRTPSARHAVYEAMKRGRATFEVLCKQLGVAQGRSWYIGDSRETIRDESINSLIDNEAMRDAKPEKSTNYPRWRYCLEPDFAALFSPDLVGDALTDAVGVWQSRHLTPIARHRAQVRRDRAGDASRVEVTLPDGRIRYLHPGLSSEILKGVIEEFAPRKLKEPNVLFISQPGEKVNLIENEALENMGLSLDEKQLLPDCILLDLAAGHETLWFIEAVASDGPITERRRQALAAWAAPARSDCRFLTAFESRTSSEAKKALPQVATGSSVWFLDEEKSLLTWEEIGTE